MTRQIKKLSDAHRDYMRKCRDMPQAVPEWWPDYMAELFASGMIQRIGNTIYLTEYGQEVAALL